MTVSSTSPRIKYNCNGSTTDFAFTFNASASDEITVILTTSAGVETTLTENSHYFVTAALNSDYSTGGTVSTCVTGDITTPYAWASGYTLTIMRVVDITQESDFVPQATLYQSFENALDKAARVDQQLQEQIDRVPMLKKSSANSDITLADPVAGEYLRWNTGGTGIESTAQVSTLGEYTASGTGAVARTIDAKLGEYVTPEDFGASGDGLTDDSPYIQLAIASLTGGGLLKGIPGSTYKWETKVTSSVANVHFDFTGCTISNAVALATETIYGETSNALLNITASHCSVKGGNWSNIASEGIRVTGAYAGGDSFTGAGYLEDIKISDVVFDDIDDNALIVRFFNDLTIQNVTVRDKGAGLTTHSKEIAIKYGLGANISDCKVLNCMNGGAFYELNVENVTYTNCIAYNLTNANASYKQDTIAYYSTYSKNINLVNCQAYQPDGGTPVKCSEEDQDISITGGIFEVAGDDDDIYAGVFFQGVNGFLVNGATIKTNVKPGIRMRIHSTPTPDENARDGIISNCKIYTTYTGTVTSPSASGSGIDYYGNATGGGIVTAPIFITGNYLYGGNIRALQIENGKISDNYLYTATDYDTAQGGIYLDRCVNIVVDNNFLKNEDTTVEAKIGIYNTASSLIWCKNNMVSFPAGPIAGSIGYYWDASGSSNYWDNNRALYAETDYSGAIPTITEGKQNSTADGGTIAHGMNSTPSSVQLTIGTAGEIITGTADGTNITVAIKKHDGTAGTTQTVFWRAVR